MQRLQKLAFDVENATLNKLVENGDITSNVLDNYLRYAERTQVYKQASLIQRIIVGIRGYFLKNVFVNACVQMQPLRSLSRIT